MMNTAMNMNNMRVNMNYCKCCNKPCYGLQCVDCDVSIPMETKASCSDCFRTFDALKKNGTIRKRCAQCQIRFEDMHLNACSDCSKFFFARRSDGTMRKRCVGCQDNFVKISLKKCDGCDNNTLKQYSFCKNCIPKKSVERVMEMDIDSSKVYKSHKCGTDGCENITTYKKCRDCNYKFRSIANEYIFSRCQYEGCGFRGKGYFMYCSVHSVV